jgi:ssDNA-binding Zn-finger/Zn-ribbon topoisomerase 1
MDNKYHYDIGFVRDEPYFNIHADTAEEVESLLKDVLPIYKRFRDAVDKSKVNQANTKAQEAGVQAKCKDCGAQMVLKKGVSKTGKQWSGLFCPNSDKNDKTKHQPVWL